MPVLNGVNYEVHHGGSLPTGRPPLVLIHGAGGTRLHWPHDLRRLSSSSVYALDLPGHGSSNGGPHRSIESFRRSVIAWMDAAGLPSAVIAGHSMGGAIALDMALQEPARVAGLVLVGTGGRLRVHPALLEAAAASDRPVEGVGVIVQWSFSEGAPERLRELAAMRMAQLPASVLHGDLLACDQFDVLPRLGEIRAPTLVIVGREDRMTPEKYAQTLAREIPGARLEIIPQAGHMVMLEQPQAVARVLDDFLSRVDSASA